MNSTKSKMRASFLVAFTQTLCSDGAQQRKFSVAYA